MNALALNALAPVAQAQPEERGNGFVDKLWQDWSKDPGRAVLLARWYWELLPKELEQQVTILEDQIRRLKNEDEITKRIDATFGRLHVPNPEIPFLEFKLWMAKIRVCRGESTSPEHAQLAEAVLRGQADPVSALVAATPAVNRQQVAMQIQQAQMMGGDPLLRLSGMIAAASVVARERIPVLISLPDGLPQPLPPDPELLKLTGRWKGGMNRYELVRDNGGYRVTMFNLFGGRIAKGQATINGSTLTLTVTGFAGSTTVDLKLKGDRLQGVSRVFGALSLPLTLRRA